LCCNRCPTKTAQLCVVCVCMPSNVRPHMPRPACATPSHPCPPAARPGSLLLQTAAWTCCAKTGAMTGSAPSWAQSAMDTHLHIQTYIVAPQSSQIFPVLSCCMPVLVMCGSQNGAQHVWGRPACTTPSYTRSSLSSRCAPWCVGGAPWWLWAARRANLKHKQFQGKGLVMARK
jgi:hypothetical protein